MLFFQCITALLNHAHRREEGIKWWPVFYTVAMFSFVTVYIGMNLGIQSNSFIDNREGNSTRSGSPNSANSTSGPLDYQSNIRQTTHGIIPNVMFTLNNWLADGLLVSSSFAARPTRPGV